MGYEHRSDSQQMDERNDPRIGMQQQRPIVEQQMPEWQRNQLDEARRLIQQDAASHPALSAALDRIESKLDAVLARLSAPVPRP